MGRVTYFAEIGLRERVLTVHVRASSSQNEVIADFESFRMDLVNKIKTGPGQYLRELITNAYEAQSQ
jgi:hypothetical protein